MLSALGLQVFVEGDDGCHGFHYGYGAGQDAWVVPAACFYCGGIAVGAYRGLFAQQGGYRLKGYSETDVVAVGDAALDTATMIGLSCDASFAVSGENVVLF